MRNKCMTNVNTGPPHYNHAYPDHWDVHHPAMVNSSNTLTALVIDRPRYLGLLAPLETIKVVRTSVTQGAQKSILERTICDRWDILHNELLYSARAFGSLGLHTDHDYAFYPWTAHYDYHRAFPDEKQARGALLKIHGVFMVVVGQLTYYSFNCRKHQICWLDRMIDNGSITPSFADRLYCSTILQNIYPGDPVIRVGMCINANVHMEWQYVELLDNLIDYYTGVDLLWLQRYSDFEIEDGHEILAITSRCQECITGTTYT